MNHAEAFKLLGLDPDQASPQDVQDAYKRKSWAGHPDQGGTLEGFAELSQARGIALEYARQVRCAECKGSGEVVVMQGFYAGRKPCPACLGTGRKFR